MDQEGSPVFGAKVSISGEDHIFNTDPDGVFFSYPVYIASEIQDIQLTASIIIGWEEYIATTQVTPVPG